MLMNKFFNWHWRWFCKHRCNPPPMAAYIAGYRAGLRAVRYGRSLISIRNRRTDMTIEPDGTVTQGFTANPEGQSRRTVMKHSWLRAPSGFLYCRNCLLVCQWPLVRSDDDCGYQAETGAEHE